MLSKQPILASDIEREGFPARGAETLKVNATPKMESRAEPHFLRLVTSGYSDLLFATRGHDERPRLVLSAGRLQLGLGSWSSPNMITVLRCVPVQFFESAVFESWGYSPSAL